MQEAKRIEVTNLDKEVAKLWLAWNEHQNWTNWMCSMNWMSKLNEYRNMDRDGGEKDG